MLKKSTRFLVCQNLLEREVYKMSTPVIVLIIVAAITVAFFIFVYFLGKRTEKKQAEQDELIEQSAQFVPMLIIDKKMMKLKESGLPQEAISQVPWYGKASKLPIVKAKVGPKIMTLIADPKVFDEIPLKKEVKAKVAGLYIVGIRGLHGKIEKPEKKQKGLRAWAMRTLKKNQDVLKDNKSKNKKK